MDSHVVIRNLQKKRTTNFREDETKLLIQLWGCPQIQNKLYLTHRKAPVMRLLAANMQHRGFYRTPDEIKTRIRNLKCLYHRIKRSMTTGAGIGTVDPDWPHFKAMDEILTRKTRPQNLYKDNILEGPKCEDIKQEIIEDIDINDDMESFGTNSVNGSEGDAEFEDEAHPMPPLMPAPPKDQPELVKITPKPLATLQNPKPFPKIIPSPQLTTTTQARTNGTVPATLPFPLLILNGLPQTTTAQQVTAAQKKPIGSTVVGSLQTQDATTNLLKNLLDVQKENLEIERQRLEIEKQKLDFQRRIGTQLTTLLPMFGAVLQRLSTANEVKEESAELEDSKLPVRTYGRKRPCPENSLDILKDSKILRNVLEEGIKRYMMSEIKDEKNESSDKEDSGIQNTDDESNTSSDKK